MVKSLYIDNGNGVVRNPDLSDEEFNTLLTEQRRADIYAQLDEIDRKSIRPAREGETARLVELTAQAVALRLELASL